MDPRVLFAGLILILLQVLCAFEDGFLSASSIYFNGIEQGYSLLEHGGTWADLFVITPFVAFIMNRYELDWRSMTSIIVLVIAIGLVLLAGHMYNLAAIHMPEAHTHDGHATMAGWIHGIFALAAFWAIAMFYFAATTPQVSRPDLIIASAILTPFFFLGVVKFSRQWTFPPPVRWQVAIETAGLWAVTLYKLRG